MASLINLKTFTDNRGNLTVIEKVVPNPVPPHQQNALKNRLKGAFPISELLHQTTISLPISFYHTTTQVEEVIENMNAF